MDTVHPTAGSGIQVMSISKRSFFWMALATAALLVVYLAPPVDQKVVAPAKAAGPRVGVTSAIAAAKPAESAKPSATIVLKLLPRSNDEDAPGSFMAEQWTVPVKVAVVKAQPAVVLPAPPPQAPALPFRFLGRYVEDGKTVVFLQHNDQNFAARVGDVLQQDYKVQAVTASAMTFIYLPLNQSLNLEIGALP